MVIEHAERFGLSQLHQLRGRVGRGAHESVCVLLYARPLSEMARARLKIIFENTDGFEIARQDLHLRGPGEFIGSRQSGVPLLSMPIWKSMPIWSRRRMPKPSACCATIRPPGFPLSRGILPAGWVVAKNC